MTHRFLIICLCLTPILTKAQKESPKLIVGVVVDQMRADYIQRYWDKLGDRGFKRLVGEGYNCQNAHYNYVPTYTGPGHASVYSGTSPMTHGIIANSWYDRAAKSGVYCVFDSTKQTIGSASVNGQVSPHRLLTPTLGDAVGIGTLFRGKVIGMSIKDRGAVLPAGHSATAAYWYDYDTGHFITSDYYMNNLPNWVSAYNEKGRSDKLVNEGWKTMLPIKQYTESTEDDTPYERSITGGKPVFPYDLKEAVERDGYKVLASTPHGNTVLRELAQACIINEKLGKDDHTDLLAVSFSSPDMVGHSYGPQSIEVEDTYLRLDKDIEALLKTLDEQVGEGNYVLFLTADHAAAQVPKYLQDHRIPVNYLSNTDLKQKMNDFLMKEFQVAGGVASYSNQQVFLEKDAVAGAKRRPAVMVSALRSFLMEQEGVAQVMTREQLSQPLPPDRFSELARAGWHPSRSGELVVQYLPGWMSYPVGGTTHGTSYNYDTHVPLIFFGKGIDQGETYEYCTITQIAASICHLSGMPLPDAATPYVIEDLFDD